MSILTRIKNNQVTDNTIEYQKLKDGTLVGSKFNANLTLNSNVTILGNLTVANSFAQLNSINTYINDPVVVFNNNYTGSPTYDIGMLVNRNLSSLAPYGAVNAAWVWKESSQAFVGIMTTETGTTAGSINNSGFANLFVGNTYANTVTIRDTVDSTSATSGVLQVAGGVGIAKALFVGGNIILDDAGLTTSNTTAYLFNENVTTLYIGSSATTTSIGKTGGVTTINGGLVATGPSTLNSNLVAASGTASTNTTTGALVVVGGAGVSGNVNVGEQLNVTGITTLNGNVVAASGTASTSPTTGALVVAGSGGLGVGGAIYNNGIHVSNGNIVAAASTPSTSITTGALVVVGGAGIGGNLNVYGNITTATGNIITTSSGIFYGNSQTGEGAIYAGIPSGYTVLPQTITQFTANIPSYAQINFQNINSGSSASTDFVATADNGTDGSHYIDMGINSSTYNDPEYSAMLADDGYLYVRGDEEGGNLVVGTATPGGVIRFISGGTDSSNIVATLYAKNTQSTSTITGTFVVTGGTGISQNLNVGGNVVIDGNLTVQGTTTTLNTSVLDVEDLNITVAKNSGSASAANGAGLTVEGASATLLYTFATDSWNVNKQFIGLGAEFANTTPSTNTTSGALIVAGGVGIGGSVNAGNAVFKAINNTPIGNATPSTGAFTTLTTTGAFVSSGNIVADSGTASTGTTTGALVVVGGAGVSGRLNVGGNIVADSGTASTNTTTGALVVNGGAGISGAIYAGSIQNTPIGSSTASTGAFTTITSSSTIISSGNVVAASGTDSSSTTTGALVVTGGIGASGRIISGGNIVAASGTSSTGTTSGALVVQGGAGVSGQVWTGDKITAGGNIVAASGTNSGNIATGALVVQGGAGIYSNVFVGGASTFNSNMTAGFDTIVKGNNDETLIWARAGSTYDQLVIGGNATVGNLVAGAKLIINSTDSMLIPTGTNAQRPSSSGGTDVQGMFRYNTTVSALEIYDGAEWDQITTQFTVIVSEAFSGDDTTTVFNMSGTSTTAATIVSINGVVQIPTTAYSVSGSTLTFTEAPATGDAIDVRRLATTSVVQGIASTNGYMQFLCDNNGAYVYTGSTSTAPTTQWNISGAEINLAPNTTVAVDNVDTQIDIFRANTYSSAEYTVTSTIRNTNIREIAKILLVHDNANVSITEYGVVSTAGNILAEFNANIVSGNVILYANVTNANTIIRVDSVLQAI